MKNKRYSDARIIGILKQAESRVPVSDLCREHGMSNASFLQMAGEVWRYGCVDDLGDKGYGGRKPPPEAYVPDAPNHTWSMDFIRRYDEVKLDRMPRMAAFAKLMAAAEPGLGWEPGAFMVAYEANRRATSEASFEADPVAVAICEFVKQEQLSAGNFWEGTATELLVELNKIVSEDVRRSRFWPSKVNAFGNAVERAVPLLRHKQVHVSKRSTGTQRLIKLVVVSAT